jgi:hypothetical protein
MGRRSLKRRSGKQWVEGKSFRLADEVRYTQKRAAIMTAGWLASVNSSCFLIQAMLGC